MQDKIYKFIQDNLKPYNFNQEVLDKMENIFQNNYKYKIAILKITIKDNTIIYEQNEGDSRKNVFIELINNAKDYFDSENKKFKDCIIYLYCSDVYAYEYKDLPFFVISRPRNRNGILIPDDTYKCHVQNNKCMDWDTTKKFVNENCLTDTKINKLFFRGANTGADKHNLRMLIYNKSKSDNKYDVTIGKHRVPLFEFCKYKYLLNLPGHQPWSYRFKYLFLMKSLVINIDINQHYNPNDYNEGWMNFFDIIWEDGEDYINLVYDWYEKNHEHNKKEYYKLLGKINSVYNNFESNPDKYEKMVTSGYNKAQNLTNELVYESIYKLFNEYAERFTDK